MFFLGVIFNEFVPLDEIIFRGFHIQVHLVRCMLVLSMTTTNMQVEYLWQSRPVKVCVSVMHALCSLLVVILPLIVSLICFAPTLKNACQVTAAHG